MKFIDLFAGLGGFHTALSRLGHKCVYACEIDPVLNKIYEDIYGIKPDFDITKVNLKKIPKYDILCAGFPCQPFSKAGSQSGFNHAVAGEMFDRLFSFLEFHKPQYFFLENVPNLLTHDKGFTWLYMKTKLEGLGYSVSQDLVSPTDFNIPQTRDRVYILGTLDNTPIKWPIPEIKNKISAKDFIIDKPKKIKRLSAEKQIVLNIWEDFLNQISDKNSIISPLWSMEFGATYPYEDTTPFALGKKKLKKFKGSFGIKLSEIQEDKIFDNLPPYSHYSNRKNEVDDKKFKFPDWKIRFIKKSRTFYSKNKSWIDPWLKRSLKHKEFRIATFQKLEWNCHGDDLKLQDKFVSFRPSGVRVKRIDNSPTLVNLSNSGLPYITSKKRYFTVEECLYLQGFHEKKFNLLLDDQYIKKLNKETNTFIYMALGNAVNVDVIEKIARTFLSNNEDIEHRKVKSQLSLNINSI